MATTPAPRAKPPRPPKPANLLEMAIEPDEQRTLIMPRWGGAKFPVVRYGSDLYGPVHPFADYLDIDFSTQLDRLKDDPRINRYMRRFYVRGRGGRQKTWCLLLKAMPLWLIMIEFDAFRPEFHDGLLVWFDTLMEAAAVLYYGTADGQPALDGDALLGDETVEALQFRLARVELELANQKFVSRLLARRVAHLERAALPPGTYFDVSPVDDEE